MDSNVASALISGVCSIISAFGAVYLKEYMDAKKQRALKPEATQLPATKPLKSTEAAPQTPPLAKPPGFRRPVAIIAGSFIFGIVTRALRPIFESHMHWESIIALIVLVVMAFSFAVFHRKSGYQIGFQLENFAMWTGWASGWSLIHGRIWGDLLGVALLWWLGCALVGGLIVATRRRR